MNDTVADAPTDTTDATAAPAPETQSAEGVSPDGSAVAPDTAKPEGEDQKGDAAPEGEAEPFTLAAPEGMEAMQGDFDKFSGAMDGWLKANPNATAREALAEAARMQGDAVMQGQAAAVEQRNSQIETWETDLRNDKEFGGAAFEANVATYSKGVEAVGSPELRTLLDETGLGSHPEVVRAFWKVGKMTADSGIATGQTGTAPKASFASALYGNGN
ncbi:hypothetical protein [Paracoccus sp. SM22M-07]|uniref:hypothetical protein n=1 Tax=Paracoccus sp. SM22M-07 TaxID=1520813 RepID=UPI000920D011|nr:hypothetical protein [Paracoccus sp. SM22M-07]OJH45184.1 hypothetical protein IE00_05865 [Paracoccus sp. SM22M-07]